MVKIDWLIKIDIFIYNNLYFFYVLCRSAEEILTMLLEASDEDVESNWDGGRVACSVRYLFEGEEDNASMSSSHQPGQHHHHHHNMERRKVQARLEIEKDDIQAVLPISKVP